MWFMYVLRGHHVQQNADKVDYCRKVSAETLKIKWKCRWY